VDVGQEVRLEYLEDGKKNHVTHSLLELGAAHRDGKRLKDDKN
jgi:hypothetical protein